MIEMTPNHEFEAARISDPDVVRIEQWQREFSPKDGVDYKWVEEYAKQQFDALKKMFDDLDGKATAIINYLTSGAGLFTLGTLAALFSAKVASWAIVCAIPSVLCAIIAVGLAAWTRKPRNVFTPPPPDQMVDMAEHFSSDETERGRALMIPIWYLCSTLLRQEIALKGKYLNLATWLMIATVASLLIPLIVGISIGPTATPPDHPG